MRKYLLLLVLLMPFSVFADKYTIKTHVGVEGKTLEANEFIFELKDYNGTVVQTKTNDLNGDVIFDPIEWNSNGIDTYRRKTEGYGTEKVNNMYHIYTIEQKQPKEKGYTIDTEKTYVMVSNNGSVVKYFKYPSDERLKADMPKYEQQPYHATDEEVQGQAYFVYDIDKKEIEIFRDEPNKYTNSQRDGNKVYYVLDETAEGAVSYTISQEYRMQAKKVIFKGSLRPTTGFSLFWFFPELEEIEGIEKLDTSRMTTMRQMFQSDKKLKVLDLTHFDFSGLTDPDAFYVFFTGLDDSVEHEVRIGDVKIPENIKYHHIIQGSYDSFTNIKSDFSWFNNYNLRSYLNNNNVLVKTVQYIYDPFENVSSKYLDFSSLKIHLSNRETYQSYGAEYPGAYLMFENMEPYYMDISGITTDYCAYQSNDITLSPDKIRIFKISEQNSSQQGFFKTDYDNPLYMYNIDHNLVSSELSNPGYQFLISNCTNEHCGWDICDSYFHGGTWINIADDDTSYMNSYIKPSLVKGITDNPKTGIVSYTLKSLIILIIMLLIYFRLFGHSYFKKY